MAPVEEDMGRLAPSGSSPLRTAFAAVLTGTVAAATATAALALLAHRNGQGPLQPINATSHILHGPAAGRQAGPDLAHTGVGAVINHGAAIFWAFPFTLWLRRAPRRSPAEIAAGAAITAGIAGAVDYGIVPRRLTPGWEHALPPRGVVLGFAALGLGLGAGAALTRSLRL